MNFVDAFSGKKVLITGHTGFKGSWLSLWLTKLGANVIGVSNGIPTQPSNFEALGLSNHISHYLIDVRNSEAISEVIWENRPDFVFHLAAQPIVGLAHDQPLDTIQTNLIGTVVVLDALRRVEHKTTCVMITSDKSYKNMEWTWGYRETDLIGGADIYSASKGMAEIAINSYIKSYFTAPDNPVQIGVARAGNVIGGGDWASGRLVPDCIDGWYRKEVVKIRHPKATRPWQHVLEPLSGYLTFAARLRSQSEIHGEAFNFGPGLEHDFDVSDVINSMSQRWGVGANVTFSDPGPGAPEAGLLRLNCDKAMSQLAWRPALDFETTINMTVDWYRKFYENSQSSMLDYSLLQLDEYISRARDRGLFWAIGPKNS